jgi:hypothetical protein
MHRVRSWTVARRCATRRANRSVPEQRQLQQEQAGKQGKRAADE